jgi:murein DD-endopeptidase MepM/ murein hydrolase activator NlpD
LICYPVGKDIPVYHGFNWGGNHRGVDWIIIPDTPVKVVKKGKVFEVAWDSDVYGGYVIVLHEDGYATLYAHLSRVLVKKDEMVKDCQVIGRSGGVPGTPGAGASKGYHLHFEVRPPGHIQYNWNNIDPMLYLESHNNTEGETK